MAIAKITNADIINGLAVFTPSPGNPSGSIYSHDDPTRTQHLPSLSGSILQQQTDGRYISSSWLEPEQPFDYDASLTTGSGALGANRVITLVAAGSNRRHRINGLFHSYSATPGSGHIQVEDGSGNIVFGRGIFSTVDTSSDFNKGLWGSPNTALIITLVGCTGAAGELSIKGHRVE